MFMDSVNALDIRSSLEYIYERGRMTDASIDLHIFHTLKLYTNHTEILQLLQLWRHLGNSALSFAFDLLCSFNVCFQVS